MEFIIQALARLSRQAEFTIQDLTPAPLGVSLLANVGYESGKQFINCGRITDGSKVLEAGLLGGLGGAAGKFANSAKAIKTLSATKGLTSSFTDATTEAISSSVSGAGSIAISFKKRKAET